MVASFQIVRLIMQVVNFTTLKLSKMTDTGS